MQKQQKKDPKTDDKEYFDYISSLIRSKDLNSLTPYYLCEEEGHQTNQLDIVCLAPDCKYRGLTCFRCQYHKHNTHASKCVPLHVFMANLIKNQNELSNFLSKKREKCYYLREYMIDSVRSVIEKIIDQFSVFVASLHKYYQLNEKRIEEITVKSDVVLHRLFFKRHINHFQFNEYVADAIQKVDGGDRRNAGEVEIIDYKEAIKITDKYLEEMGGWAKELNNNAEKLYFQAKKDIRLNIFSNEEMKGLEEEKIQKELKGFTQNLLDKVKNSFKADFPRPSLLLLDQQKNPSNTDTKPSENTKKEPKLFSNDDENDQIPSKNASLIKTWRDNYLNFH